MEPSALRHFSHPGGEKVLYCGDDDVDLAAVYLSSILNAEGYDLDYIPSRLPFPPELDPAAYGLIIFSDYPRAQVRDEDMEKIAAQVLRGASFLMIGGWESFTGLNIEYRRSPLEALLPVYLQDTDDRRNVAQGIVVLPAERGKALTDGLDWEHPALIGGYNAFTPKDEAGVRLNGYRLVISAERGGIKAEPSATPIPLLVTGRAGKGKTAALAFDLAPHWIGGFVDWGTERKRVEFNDGFIEVGNHYYRFVKNLIADMF